MSTCPFILVFIVKKNIGGSRLWRNRKEPNRGRYFRNVWVGMCSWNPQILTLHQSPTILDKINGKPRPPPPPPPPNQGWENGAFLPFARLHPWFGGDGGLLFHFILSKIVVKLIFATLLEFKLPKSLCILQYCYFPKVTKVKVFFAVKLSCG